MLLRLPRQHSPQPFGSLVRVIGQRAKVLEDSRPEENVGRLQLILQGEQVLSQLVLLLVGVVVGFYNVGRRIQAEIDRDRRRSLREQRKDKPL